MKIEVTRPVFNLPRPKELNPFALTPFSVSGALSLLRGPGCEWWDPLPVVSPGAGEKELDEANAKSEERIAAAAAVKTPEVVLASVFKCEADLCRGAVLFISIKEQTVLGAIQVKTKSIDHGEKVDQARLAVAASERPWFKQWVDRNTR